MFKTVRVYPKNRELIFFKILTKGAFGLKILRRVLEILILTTFVL
jgi:hypothetical protein